MNIAEYRQLGSRGKFGNKKTEYNGVLYHSKKEAVRAQELDLLLKVGAISDLERQVSYLLSVNGVKICRYIADFRYVVRGKVVVEDVKGFSTDIFKLKKKLMLACHGIEILET